MCTLSIHTYILYSQSFPKDISHNQYIIHRIFKLNMWQKWKQNNILKAINSSKAACLVISHLQNKTRHLRWELNSLVHENVGSGMLVIARHIWNMNWWTDLENTFFSFVIDCCQTVPRVFKLIQIHRMLYAICINAVRKKITATVADRTFDRKPKMFFGQ